MLKASLKTIVIAVAALVLFCSFTRTSFAENDKANIILLSSSYSKPYVDVMDGFKGQLHKDGIRANYSVILVNDEVVLPGDILEAVEQEEPDLIVALGSRALEWINKHRPERPIIASMVLGIDDVDVSLNVTGVVLEFPLQTQLRWILRALPEAKKIGIIYNPGENQKTVDDAEQLADQHGLEIIARPVNTPGELPAALKDMARLVDVVWGISDSVVTSPKTAQVILLSCFRSRIPYFGLSSSWVKAGALLGLDRDYIDIGAQIAEKARLVLQGTPPNALPLDSPRKENRLLNLKVANHLKLKLPQGFLEEVSQTY